MLKIDNLHFRYKNETLNYRYDIGIHQGEIIAIIGESGSGKSTLLELISGFLEPLSGSMMFNEIELNKLPIEKRPCSILFQKDNLFEHLSVYDNITLGKKGMPKEEVDAILEEVGLGGYQDKIASNLSGGEQQRVALARVLIRDKPILLLDEPFSGLDEKRHDEMLDLVQKITHSHGLYTLMVTHFKKDIEGIANGSYEMKEGRLISC